MKNRFIGTTRTLNDTLRIIARVQAKNWPAAFKMLISALIYASAGLRVLPVRQDKSPACPHGVKDASLDPVQLRRWFLVKNPPLIGVACGKIAGADQQLLGLDLDKAKPKRTSGFDWLLFLPDDRRESLQGGLGIATPSGGAHRWLLAPADVSLKNSAGEVAAGVDIRGEGGFLIAPPSSTYKVVSVEPPRMAPKWFLETPGVTKTRSPEITRTIPSPSQIILPTYPASARDKERIKAMASTPEGARNTALLTHAIAMGANGVDNGAALSLSQAAITAGMPATEAYKTCANGLRYGRAERFTEIAAKTSALTPIKTSPSLEFPIDALPPVLHDYVAFEAERLDADPAGPATAVIAALASATSRRFQVEPWPGYRVSSCVLWYLLSGMTGMRKTDIIKAGTARLSPLLRRCEEMNKVARRKFSAEWANFKEDCSDWSKRRRKDKATAGDPPTEPQQPLPWDCLTTDPTREGLASLLQAGRSTALHLDEAGSWLLSLNETSALKTRGEILSYWNGGATRQHRKSAP